MFIPLVPRVVSSVCRTLRFAAPTRFYLRLLYIIMFIRITTHIMLTRNTTHAARHNACDEQVCVLFYVQKWSTMTWCEPKQKRFLSTHSLPKLIWSLFLASFVLVSTIPHSLPSLAAKAHLVAVSRFVCACEYHTSLPPLTRCQSSSGRCFSLRLCL
jgi:hypothetical protein